MNKKQKLATVLFVAWLVTLSLVYAAYTQSQNIFWHYENIEVGVYTSEGCTTVMQTPLDLGAVVPTGTQNIEFWIRNEGNVAVDVSLVNEVIVNATKSWAPTGLANLGVDAVACMTLTLTFTGEDGGSYDFDFQAVKHP
jgi:hypothetical protein